MMSVVGPEVLSFDRHLRHAFAPLSARLETGIKSLDAVIEILRLRIEAEAQFSSSLERIIKNEKLLSYLSPTESLRKDGLDAIHADMKNEYSQRCEFVNSLNEDVYQPIIAMRELYASKNRLFANDTKSNIKALRSQQNTFYKIKAKYEKVCKEASSARTALLNAKLDSKISSQQILKLGSKVNSTLKTQQSWKEKYDEQQVVWNRQQIKFDDEMTSILQGMQANEYNRMMTTKDSLNKWAVFITNLCANRNYDVKNLAESMSLINIDKDLQIFITQTLQQYPSKNPNGQIPPHHALYYGKTHQNAISNLNKTSQQNNGSSLNLNKKPKKNEKSISRQRSHTHSKQNGQNGHQRQSSMSSMSFSSYNPAYYQQRKGSASYSLSEQHQIMQELSKRQIRQQSTPNSVGSFFKQKFQKQRSYNSHRSDTNNHDGLREHSNTISSFHESEVHLPIDEDHAHSPRAYNGYNLSPRLSPAINGSPRRKGSHHSPSDNDPELPSLGTLGDPNVIYGNGTKHSVSFDALEHPIQPNSAQHRQQMKRKKKLKKPSAKTKKKSFKYNKTYINSTSPPPQQSQNTLSYTESNHNHSHQQQQQHQQQQKQPSPIKTTATPTSTTKTVSISKSTASPRFKLVQTPQIIVIKRKKSKSPSLPPTTPHKQGHQNDDLQAMEIEQGRVSTPELSADSTPEFIKNKKIAPSHDQDTDDDEIDPLD